jgi:hypothetical protein
MVSAGDLRSGLPRPWMRLGAMAGSTLVALIGFTSSPGIGLALLGVVLLVWVGISVWAVRHGRRRARSLREAGEKPDFAYLERRLLIYFWLLLLALLGTTVSLFPLLTSPGRRGPTWPLVLPVVLMAAALMVIGVFARVVLPRRRAR